MEAYKGVVHMYRVAEGERVQRGGEHPIGRSHCAEADGKVLLSIQSV